MSKKQAIPIAKWIAALTGSGKGIEAAPPDEDYGAYLAATEPDDGALAQQRAYAFDRMPRFYIVIKGKGRQADVKRTRAALERQTYPAWEVCDDPAAAGETEDFVMRIEEGDILSPQALFCFAVAADAHRDKFLYYADEDVLVGDVRERPLFKPEFSRVTALSYDLFGRPLAIRRDVYLASRPPARDAEEAEEYAFALRCLERTQTAMHIPLVLLSRSLPPEPMDAAGGCRAISGFLSNTKEDATVSTGLWPGSFFVAARGKPNKRTAIVIPNREGLEALRRALESIEECCPMDEYTIVIADGGSESPRLLHYYDLLEKNKAARIVHCEKKGFATLCNAGADAAPSDGLLFLSRDAELLSPDTLRVLSGQVARPGVGAAGCKLVDEKRRIVFAGGVAGLCGKTGSPYAGEEDIAPGDCDSRRLLFTETLRTVTLLSGACMYLPTDVFLSAGRFDETFDDPVVAGVAPLGADAELSVRLLRRGLACVYTPFATAMLHRVLPAVDEAGDGVALRCQDALRELILAGDPYYSPNLVLNRAIPVVKREI